MLRLESSLQKQRFGWLSSKVKSLPWEKGTCPHHRGIFSSFQESRQWGSTRSTRSSPSLCRRCPPWGKNLGWSWLCGWSNSEYLELLNNDSEQILDDIKAPYQLLLGSVVLKIRISPLHCCDARHRQSSLSTWHLAAEGVQEKDAGALRDHIMHFIQKQINLRVSDNFQRKILLRKDVYQGTWMKPSSSLACCSETAHRRTRT